MKEILREIGMIAKALDLKNRDKEWSLLKRETREIIDYMKERLI
ncbi:hypothetical protein AB4X15_21225 [Peribacillus simplex]